MTEPDLDRVFYSKKGCRCISLPPSTLVAAAMATCLRRGATGQIHGRGCQLIERASYAAVGVSLLSNRPS